VDDWSSFDVFELERLAGKHTLQVLAFHLFETRLGALSHFKILPAHFANYFKAVEEGYNDPATVPYHNHIHAADVLANTFYFLTRPSVRSRLTELDLFVGCLAAAVHDYAHPGTNNAFAVATGHPLAMRYNDHAVLESMHVSEASLLMRRPHHDILAGMTSAQRKECRSTLIAAVLATDMTSHFKNLAELKAQIAANEKAAAAAAGGGGGGASVFSALGGGGIAPLAQRVMAVEVALHASDLGNPAKPLPLYIEWTRRINEEFWAQGDAEKARGLPISAMCDRSNPNVERSQLGFLDFIVAPLYDTYVQINPDIRQDVLSHIAHNRAHYAKLVAQLPK
jgi:cAMP-specific phosphodiesterase 4